MSLLNHGTENQYWEKSTFRLKSNENIFQITLLPMSLSLKDLVNKADVSKTTVSLVLNGKSSIYRISKETENRILKIAKDHNY